MALKPVPFSGGLDLMTPAPLVPPGTKRECLNYERGIRQGDTRIDGFQRFDGTEPIANYQCWKLVVGEYTSAGGDWPASFSAGQSFYLDKDSSPTTSATGYLLADWTPNLSGVVPLPAPDTIYLMFSATVDATLYLRLKTGVLTSSVRILSATAITQMEKESGMGTTAAFNTALDLIVATRRAQITQVPGHPGSDIIGLFWLKNRLHAIRDLIRVPFTSGLYTDSDEGKFVTYNGASHEILAVSIWGGSTGHGFLSLAPTSGSGTAAAPLLAPTFFTVSGTAPDCDVNVDYNEAAAGFTFTSANGTAPLTWAVLDDAVYDVASLDAGDADLQTQRTHAALFVADPTNGWTRQELGREVRIVNADPATLLNFSREPVQDLTQIKNTTGVSPTAGFHNDVSTTAMNSFGGASEALSGASGDVFVVTGFGTALATQIPVNALIVGIQVTVIRTAAGANDAIDNTVTLIGLGRDAENKARTSLWSVLTTAGYGASTANDLWGLSDITRDEVTSSSFGVLIIADRANPAVATSGNIDHVTMVVNYIERGRVAYVRDTVLGTDQVISIQHVCIDDVNRGYLTITAPQNADKVGRIMDDCQIRTASGGGGTLLATVDGQDTPIFFPGQPDIEHNLSAYEAEVSNFYASDEFDAAYVVCGVGPMLVWDGVRAIRIRTDMDQQIDNPRHVARHGAKLCLGYFGGAMVQSQANDPLEMHATRGALYTPFGDRITGLRGRAADELLVPCETSTQYYSGYTEAAAIRQIISRNRGMLEYTDADVGAVLGSDTLGIFDIRTAYNFGPAERNYLSMVVAPWLRLRLQAVESNSQLSIRPTVAYPVRGKNQFRMAFNDGYQLTLTLSEPMEFSTQRFTHPSQNNRPLPMRAVCSGVDAYGRERLFASFHGGKEGYVVELDTGRSFDGDAIPAYLILNPISTQAGAPSGLGRQDRLFVYGSGYGVANLTVSRNVDYDEPDTANTLPLVLGVSTARATTLASPMRGAVDFPVEGYDVTWRFDSNTATEGPHTLQFTNLFVDDRGFSRGHT